MPILNEKDALLVRDTFDLLSDEEKPRASEWMQKYEAQQNDLGEPLFPSQVQAMSQNRDAVRKMFDGVNKVQAEISPWSENPNQDRAVHANMALLSYRYGKKPQEIADRYEFYLNDYAAQKFGVTQGVDDLSFYAAAAKELQREKQKEDTSTEGVKAALRGDDVIPALQAWQAKNLDRMPDSTEFTRGFLQARERAGDQLEFADTLIKQIESNTGLTKGEGATRPAPASRETAAQFEESLATLAAMKPKDRKQVYAIIGAKAESAGYDQKGFWAQMLSELGKGTARMGSTVTTQMGVTGDVLANLPGMLSNTVTPEEFAATDVSIARRQGIGEMYDEVARIVAGEVDPVRPVISWMNDTVETGLIKGPGAVAPFMMASAALGPFGAGALFTADFAEQNRRELRASGMDNAQAVAVGAAAAPLQAVVESLSNALQLGRFPAVQRVLSNFTKPIGGGSGLAVRYLQNAGLSLATEFTEEQLQDNFIVPATQELFGALESDMPQVDWSMYRNRAIESTPELLSVLAPMALVFGGTMTSAQANLSSAAISSQDMLEAAGYSAAQANDVRIQPTEEAKIAKAREFWGARAGTPQSIETAAKTVGERMRMLQGDAIAAQKDLESRGILPRMLRASESAWRLTFNDGSTADFNSHREADAARWQWATDQLGKVHLATRSALAQLESGAAVGREFAVEFKPDVMTAQMAVEEGRVDPAQIQRRVQQGAAVGESAAEPVNETETFDNAVATDKATSDYLASLQILGSSSNEFKDGVLRTTIRLYEGANVLTLVEEKLEGDAKQIIASKPGREWMLAKLREYERVSGDSLFRKVADDSELQNDDLIEAWSSLGQSYLVGKSKKGAAIGKGGGRRIFADVLKAGMAGAMNSETQFFNAVWRRAAKLSKLKREGKLGDDLTEELERQLGIDSQAKFENESAAEAEAIANEALNVGGASYSEENPGPNGETFSIGRVKNGGRLLTFEKPIETPIGRVVSYEWQSDVIEDVDKDGEAVLKRVSDWDKAISNAETGRAIVHHFTVIQPDGTEKIVSLESALKATKGTEAGKALSAAVKAARRLPLREAELIELEKLQGDYDAAIKEANSQSWRNAPEPELRTPEFPPLAERGVRAVYVGDQFIKNLDPNELGAFGYKPAEIEWKKQWAIGQLQRPPYGTLDRIQTLRRLIKKDKALIDSASLFSSRAAGGTFSIRSGDAEPFYSKLSQVIEQKMPNLADVATIKGIINNPQTGIKAEEVKWSGIMPWLESQTGPITKQAVLDYLANDGAVKFEEVRLGQRPQNLPDDVSVSQVQTDQWMIFADDAEPDSGTSIFVTRKEIEDFDEDGDPITTTQYVVAPESESFESNYERFDTFEEAINLARSLAVGARNKWVDEKAQAAPKFAQYQLPGGENYREVVLAMPFAETPVFRKVFQTRAKAEYTSSHFPDVPNYVAHARLNDRTDAEGKPGTFIEEIQSDRHQAGRKQGYADKEGVAEFDRLTKEIQRREEAGERIATSPELAALASNQAELAYTSAKADGIPDAPFRTTWPLQMFKRALADAVAQGKQWIGWTTGETQAERYDLSKQVSEIAHWRVDDDYYGLTVIGANGDTILDQWEGSASKMADVIGKELAQRVVESEGTDTPEISKFLGRSGSLPEGVKVIQGDGLKVGGEGMKGFYDNILPKEIGKYVKQWGAGVVKGEVMGTKRLQADAQGLWMVEGNEERFTSRAKALAAQPKTTPIWRVDITPQMRTGVQSGQTSFSIRSGDFASRMAAAFSPFQRNPELRLAIAQVAKARALKLGAEWIEEASVIRSAGDIGKEARMREAMAYETRMNDYMDGLSEAGRLNLEFEPASLADDPLISAMLDHGKLMSRSTAIKNGVQNMDEYEGAPWLPPAWYSKGAGITPGKMAKALHEGANGMGGPLTAGDSAADLWDALAIAIESTRKNKAAHREAVTAYKAAQKYAKDASRAEADKWAEGAKKKAGSPKAQRDMLKAALRTLDGILAAAPPEVRAKVGGYVKLAGLATDEAMLQEIERRIEKLNVELEKYLKKEGIEQIEKLFKKARPDSEAGKKDKGKNADMHALFAAAERAAKMDEVAVAGELARLDSLIGGDTLTADQEALAITERGIVELVGDLKHADAGRVFSALDTLRDIYEGGWIKWKLAQIEKREERAGMRAAFIADTGKTGIKPERDAAEREAETLLGKIKGGFLSLSSFHEVLSYAFGSNSARVKSLVDAEREAAGQYEDVNQALADEVQDLFTGLAGGKVLAGEKLRFDMAQRTIQTVKGELSQLGAIQALLMWRQEDGRRHMEGQLGEDGKPISSWSYDQAWIDEITAQLTPEAKSVMAWIMQKYGAEHAVLNPLYRQRYGVNMPAHDNYAPITVQPVQAKAGEVIDPVSGAAMSSGSILTPGSLRTRSRNAIAEPEFRDALQTLLMHTRQLEYWKAYYDLALESSAILGNREVLNSVKAKGGEQAATALRKWIDAIAQGGFRDASASLEMNKMLQRMTGRAASVGLLGRFSTLLVQSTQLAAASVKMPLGAYISGFGRLWVGLIPGLKMSNIWGDAIRSPFIQRRYKSAPPIVRQAMEGLAAASRPNQIKRATRALGQLLSGTDALFTAGTYALLLDYHRGTGRALGLTGADLDEHAHTEAQRDTEQVAQPTRMAARSLAEITSTNPLAKVSWAYASEARQKIALLAWATTKVKSEPAQFAKTAFLVFGVGGLLTQVLKGLWREAKGDDDEKKWSAERLTLAALTGPLHGVPLASELMGDQGMLSGVAWAWPALKDVASGEADMRDVDTLLSTLGLFNDTAAAVASLSHAGLDAAKVIENLADKK